MIIGKIWFYEHELTVLTRIIRVNKNKYKHFNIDKEMIGIE